MMIRNPSTPPTVSVAEELVDTLGGIILMLAQELVNMIDSELADTQHS